jgi:hypothetical protein
MLLQKFLKQTSRLITVTVMVSSASLATAADEAFQQRPVALVASDFLPKSLLSGEGYIPSMNG